MFSMANAKDDFDDCDDSSGDENGDQKIEDEVDLYLSEKPTSSEKKQKQSWKLNPLEYWKSRCARYPHLAQFARRVFVIRPSQAPVESQFSLGRQLLDGRCHQLSAQHFHDYLWLNSYFKNHDKMQIRND